MSLFGDFFSSSGVGGLFGQDPLRPVDITPQQQPQKDLDWGHILGILGATLKDVGNKGQTNNLGTYEQQFQAIADKAQRDAIAQRLGGAFTQPNQVAVTPQVTDASGPPGAATPMDDPATAAARQVATAQNAQPYATPSMSDLAPMLVQGVNAGVDPSPYLALQKAEAGPDQTHTLSPDELQAGRYPAGSIVQRKPDGTVNIVYKPNLPMSDQEKADFQWKQAHEYHAPVQPTVDHNVMMPILQKMQAGQPLTPGEQQVLETMKPQAAPAEGDPAVDSVAQGIANYQMQPLSGYAMSRPRGQAIMARVKQLNPNYSTQQYNASNKAYSAFTSGTQGNQVRSLNVAIQHLDVLGDTAKALANGNVKLANSLAQSYAEQTGQPAPTNFDAVKGLVGAEITKAVVAGGGALGDREEIAKTLSQAGSPGQLSGVANNYKYLLAGQMNGLQKQYEKSTMRKDFGSFLLPETLTALSHARAPKPTTGNSGTGSRPPPPLPGTVRNGYKFKGGDPSDKNNWSPVQ